MTDQQGSARFQALLESAVQAYERKAGVTLTDWEDSLAMRLQRCHSVDDIATLIQGQAQSFNDFRKRDRIFKSIKTTVSILSPISSVASNVDLVRRKVPKAYFTSLTVFTDITPTCKGDTRYSRYPTEGMYPFLSPYRYPSDVQLDQAANGVITSCDVLADMLESIEHFVNRLRIYTETSHSLPAVDEIVVKLMVELISALALVTRKLKKRRLREPFLVDAIPYSARRSQMGKKFLWGQGHQRDTTEARATPARRGSGCRSPDPQGRRG